MVFLINEFADFFIASFAFFLALLFIYLAYLELKCQYDTRLQLTLVIFLVHGMKRPSFCLQVWMQISG